MIKRVLLLAVLLASCTRGGDGLAGVRTFPDLSHAHVKGTLTYAPTPPVGGPHNARWLRCGIYAEPVPNEFAVHSMEHGTVWITYRPGLPAGDLATLRSLQRHRPEYFLLSPYAGLPSSVVASTWGAQLRVDRASDERLAAFVRKYAGGNQGGEMGADCVNGLTPDQARAALDT